MPTMAIATMDIAIVNADMANGYVHHSDRYCGHGDRASNRSSHRAIAPWSLSAVAKFYSVWRGVGTSGRTFVAPAKYSVASTSHAHRIHKVSSRIRVASTLHPRRTSYVPCRTHVTYPCRNHVVSTSRPRRFTSQARRIHVVPTTYHVAYTLYPRSNTPI